MGRLDLEVLECQAWEFQLEPSGKEHVNKHSTIQLLSLEANTPLHEQKQLPPAHQTAPQAHPALAGMPPVSGSSGGGGGRICFH